MTRAEAIAALIATAEGEIGYKEPNGDNHQKYAAWIDQTYPPTEWYNGRKDVGSDWCTIFVDWCFLHTFGVEAATRILNRDSKYGKMAAVVQYMYRCLLEVGRVGTEPHPGDIIFYHNDKYDGMAQLSHVGIVQKVTDTYVWAIEGNAGKKSDEVYVRKIRRNYDTKAWGIYGYGYPDYSAAEPEPAPDPKTLDGYTVGEEYQVVCSEPLNVRTKAEVAADAQIVKELQKGERIVCLAITRDSEGNTWLRIDSGWACAIYRGDRYIAEPSKPKTLDGYTVGETYKVVAKNGLWERSTPTTSSSSNRVRVLAYGTEIKCRDVRSVGSDTWVQAGDGCWCAGKFNGDTYLR